MKIILVGGGKVGSALCRSLVAEKHDVLLIEQDEAVLNHIVNRFDIMGILGNGADFTILEQASVQDCDCLLYTSPSPRDRQKSRMPSSA